jgi:hypothetical protein
MRRMRMTRTIACLLSLFIPLIVVFPAVLVFVSLPRMPEWLSAFLLIAVAAGIIALRVHFASWYARDKGRAAGWGMLGALGIVGWLFLWSLNDQGFRFVR